MDTDKSGKLIVFEGLDGSGTTTQSDLLAAYLEEKGHSVMRVEEPGGTDLGREIRQLLLGDHGLDIEPLSELFLYEVSRAQLVREKIEPVLNRGGYIISDRFAISSVAYQGYGRGIPRDTVRQLNEVALGGVRSDITFFLDIDLEEREKRVLGTQPDRIEREEEDFYRRVRQGYLKEIENEPRAVIIDGSRSREEIAARVVSEVERL